MAEGLSKKRWLELRDQARQRWPRLTPEDIAGVEGETDRLAERIANAYDLSREEARRQIDTWATELKKENETP
jgi:hypothetical protein